MANGPTGPIGPTGPTSGPTGLELLLMGKCYAHHYDDHQVVTVCFVPAHVGDGNIVAYVPKSVGSLDAQRIMAGNIAWALNVERGQTQ